MRRAPGHAHPPRPAIAVKTLRPRMRNARRSADRGRAPLPEAISATETVLLDKPATDGEAMLWKIERRYKPAMASRVEASSTRHTPTFIASAHKGGHDQCMHNSASVKSSDSPSTRVLAPSLECICAPLGSRADLREDDHVARVGKGPYELGKAVFSQSGPVQRRTLSHIPISFPRTWEAWRKDGFATDWVAHHFHPRGLPPRRLAARDIGRSPSGRVTDIHKRVD